ncbi:MAG: hypothetical protein DRJ11_00340 [Candidatus Aminicenantes bacterium]|nr:MAG: hypothetical protein DRJ11_00340 [Candidatus Aminicenantes bacterium]
MDQRRNKLIIITHISRQKIILFLIGSTNNKNQVNFIPEKKFHRKSFRPKFILKLPERSLNQQLHPGSVLFYLIQKNMVE